MGHGFIWWRPSGATSSWRNNCDVSTCACCLETLKTKMSCHDTSGEPRNYRACTILTSLAALCFIFHAHDGVQNAWTRCVKMDLISSSQSEDKKSSRSGRYFLHVLIQRHVPIMFCHVTLCETNLVFRYVTLSWADCPPKENCTYCTAKIDYISV
jgi:hypothetical protein